MISPMSRLRGWRTLSKTSFSLILHLHEMKTVLLDPDLEIRVRKSRVRNLRITVRPGGAVSLVLPYFVSYKRGLAFLREKHAWISQKKHELAREPVSFLRRGGPEEFRAHRDGAREAVAAGIEKFQGCSTKRAKKISIRNQKTRWGSCSRAGTLCFNYRLVFLPERLREYVIVHELCHLEEFNHSRNFWNRVAETLPDYLARRQELRSFGSRQA